MDRNLALEAVRVTEAAALAAAGLMGRGDRHGADQAATTAMRQTLGFMHIDGTIVIGEGERDAPTVDIAVDPLDGTNLCATGDWDAIAVIAFAERGRFLAAPDTYMEKLAVGHGAPPLRGQTALRRPGRAQAGFVSVHRDDDGSMGNR